MTDEELIQELRDMGEHPSRADLPMGKTLRDAADRIEALQAENAKLREALAEQVGECFCYPDCEMCFRHAQLLKETGQ